MKNKNATGTLVVKTVQYRYTTSQKCIQKNPKKCTKNPKNKNAQKTQKTKMHKKPKR